MRKFCASSFDQSQSENTIFTSHVFLIQLVFAHFSVSYEHYIIQSLKPSFFLICEKIWLTSNFTRDCILKSDSVFLDTIVVVNSVCFMLV